MQKSSMTVSVTVAALLCVLGLDFSNAQTSVIDQAPEQLEPIVAPFGRFEYARPTFPEKEFDIRNYSAVEGGTVINTKAIRKAIEAASAAGGGKVIIPAGTWLTGAIHLENNVNLFLTKGSELLFSQNTDDYLPVVFSRHEDTECYKFSAFVYADGKRNIAITGEGTLNGQGKPWWNWKQGQKGSEARVVQMGNENIPVKERIFDGKNGNYLRPAFFQPMNCTNVLVEGVIFLYGAFWTITPTYCDSVIVRKVKIITDGPYGHTPNGDGVDPSSSRNVLIEYCQFSTGDDCIAIKSGRDKDGLRVNKPTENVFVRHCTGYKGHGGISLGSETSGGIRNIFGYDCAFNGPDRMVRIKTTRGRGGVLENLWFEHLSADTILQEAVQVTMLYTGKRLPEQPVSSSTPTIRDVHFSDISCASANSNAIEIAGLPERAISAISFENITINSSKGILCVDADSITFTKASVTTAIWPFAHIVDGRNILFDSVRVAEGANPFLRVEGANSKAISVIRTSLTGARNAFEIGSEVPFDAVKFK